MKILYVAGSDKSHRNVLLIPNADVLINNISAYTVGVSWNILWFMGIKYFNCDRQLSGKLYLAGSVWPEAIQNSPRKCCMLTHWSHWWYHNLQIVSTVKALSIHFSGLNELEISSLRFFSVHKIPLIQHLALLDLVFYSLHVNL